MSVDRALMPRVCTVTGSFTREGEPIDGYITFTPTRLWVVNDGVAWATLAPSAQLSFDGGFTLDVTSTDSDLARWYYRVDCPAGHYNVYIPWAEGGRSLKDLIDEHRAGPRASDR